MAVDDTNAGAAAKEPGIGGGVVAELQVLGGGLDVSRGEELE